jgi:hypothetical protein
MKAKVSLKLKGRNSLLMRTHGIESLYPLPKRNVGSVHNGSYRHGKLLPAIFAAKQTISDFYRLAINSHNIFAFASGTLNTFRPTDTFKDVSCLILSQSAYVYRRHL